MKRIIVFSYIIFFSMQCFCMNLSLNYEASKIMDYVLATKYEEADLYLKEHNKELDSTTCDFLTSLINTGLFAKGKEINIEYTIDCIKNVINEFSEQKEEIALSSGMMYYFNIYVSFLTKVGSSYYLDVYKLFKEIWPTIDKDNSIIYIYVLENTMYQAYIDKQYNAVMPVVKELIELNNNGYQLDNSLYVFYIYLGNCYKIIEYYDEAAKYFDKALMYFSANDKVTDYILYINAVRDRFEVAFKLSQISKCRELGKILLNYYCYNEEFIQDYINVSMELSEIELSAYHAKDGVDYYEKALQLILRSSDYNAASKKEFLENLYTIYNTCNINEKDRKFQYEAKEYKINTEKKMTPIVVDDQYIDLLSNMIDTQETGKIENIRQFVDDVQTLATNYGARHKELQGIRLIETAIDRCKENNVKEQIYIKLYSTIGTIYSNLHNTDKALEYHKKANSIYTRNGIYDANYIDNLCYLSRDYLFRDELALAKAHLDEAWDVSQSMDILKFDKTIYYHLLHDYGELYKKIGEEEKALFYNSMIIEDISNNDQTSIYKKVYQLARVELLLYFFRYKEAQNLLNEIGNEFIEKNGGWWTSFETKFFNNDTICVYDLEKLSEREKEHTLKLYSSFDTPTLNDFWNVSGGNMNMAYSMSLYKFNTPTLRTLTYNNLLFTKNYQLEINKYNRAHPDEPISSDTANNILKSIGNVSMIKEKMNENEVAVEFFFIKNRKSYREIENKYGALLLKKDLQEPIFIELCACDSLDKLVYNTFGEAEIYADKMYNINNSTLYHLIWEPIEKEIATHSKVYVSGCGATMYINLSALSNGKVRLSELYDIHNVVSTSTIFSDKSLQHNYKSAVLFGGVDYDTTLDVMASQAKKYTYDDIPEQYTMIRGENERGSWAKLKYSLEETNSIADYLSNSNISVRKYTQSDASEEAFKSLSGSSPSIIHISTHGFYYQPYAHSHLTDYSNIYFSNENNNILNFNGLLFSGANNAWKYNKFQDHVEDGILTAKEIFSLNLSNTALLILSACQTGLGEYNEVDGNEGLLKAFKAAGVNKVIMTLWNISDDASSTFMKEFYKFFLIDKDPNEAIKKTINKVKQEMPDPYYWAPFIIIE